MSTDVQIGLLKDTHQYPTSLKRRLQVERVAINDHGVATGT